MESDLINLADAANSTHNMLGGQEAGFSAAGMPARVVGSLQAAIAGKTRPVFALRIGERPGLFSPLRSFNSN
jgi:hypothetical protein